MDFPHNTPIETHVINEFTGKVSLSYFRSHCKTKDTSCENQFFLPSHAVLLFHSRLLHLPTFPAPHISVRQSWCTQAQRVSLQADAGKIRNAKTENRCTVLTPTRSRENMKWPSWNLSLEPQKIYVPQKKKNHNRKIIALIWLQLMPITQLLWTSLQ